MFHVFECKFRFPVYFGGPCQVLQKFIILFIPSLFNIRIHPDTIFRTNYHFCCVSIGKTALFPPALNTPIKKSYHGENKLKNILAESDRAHECGSNDIQHAIVSQTIWLGTPKRALGLGEPSNCDGFVKSLKIRGHPQLLSHLFIALEKS